MIKNIIFDVGGVLLSYRYIEMLTDAGYSEEDAYRIGSEMFNGGLWDKLDGGLMPYDEVKRRYMEQFPDDAKGIAYMMDYPELMSVDRQAVWDKVHEIKVSKDYKMYILSNYSKEMITAHTNHASFWQDMDGEVVSYQVKCVKPNPLIYQILLEKYKLDASECLFLDDRLENVEGAKKCGIEAIQILSEEHMLEVLDRL